MASEVIPGPGTVYLGAVSAVAPAAGNAFETVDTSVWSEFGDLSEDGVTYNRELTNKPVPALGKKEFVKLIPQKDHLSIDVPVIDSRLETRAKVTGQSTTPTTATATAYPTIKFDDVFVGAEFALLIAYEAPYVTSGPMYHYVDRVAVNDLSDSTWNEDEHMLTVNFQRVEAANGGLGHWISASGAKS